MFYCTLNSSEETNFSPSFLCISWRAAYINCTNLQFHYSRRQCCGSGWTWSGSEFGHKENPGSEFGPLKSKTFAFIKKFDYWWIFHYLMRNNYGLLTLKEKFESSMVLIKDGRSECVAQVCKIGNFSFEIITKCLQQIEIPDLPHMCA